MAPDCPVGRGAKKARPAFGFFIRPSPPAAGQNCLPARGAKKVNYISQNFNGYGIDSHLLSAYNEDENM